MVDFNQPTNLFLYANTKQNFVIEFLPWYLYRIFRTVDGKFLFLILYNFAEKWKKPCNLMKKKKSWNTELWLTNFRLS